MIEQIQMTKDELAELPEYSCSFPTMTTIGKRWKRNTTFGSPSYSLYGPWMIGEYVESDEPGKVAILWKNVIGNDIQNENLNDSESNQLLVPSKDWVTNSALTYGPLCPACSVSAENRAVHRAWHLAIFERTEKPPSSLGWGR